ncbi:hypothetical protein BGZ46_008798 [Entomortierella lignicola]|nr:hypothetical protein BGZ46_008798 [Entomortierella lignicola]
MYVMIFLEIQIGLIVTSSITAATIYKKTENPYYLAGSLIMGSILPYTYAFIMPINWTLLDILDGKKTGDVEQLLLKWDMFHVARTIAGLTSLGLILYGELSGQRVIALR